MTAPELPIGLLTVAESNALRRLANDYVFRRNLDRLSEEVMELVDGFLHDHVSLLRSHLQGDLHDIEAVISFLCGWMLGFPGAAASPSDADLVVSRQIVIAVFAAGLSSQLCRPVTQRRPS